MRRTIPLTILVCAACGGEPADPATAVTEVTANGLTHQGGDFQFHSSFAPSNAPYGGFGGGACSASRTPVIFISGNGDPVKNWDYPSSTGVPSVYETFRDAGYDDCELFGVNYLSASQRDQPTSVYHTAARAALIADFIDDVKAYTGRSKVDIVSHSLGVTMVLEGLRQHSLWSSTRRFIAISGGLRGLASCYYVGYANYAAPVCGSANWYDATVFGFYPNQWYAPNPRMANGGFRDDPSRSTSTRFYVISAGYQDQVACTTSSYYSGCYATHLFDDRSNVRAQLFVGQGSTAAQYDYDFSDWSPYNSAGGDLDGVGHFRSKNNTGAIQVRMLSTTCSGTGCCTGYGGVCY